jgi:hypothetical protein
VHTRSPGAVRVIEAARAGRGRAATHEVSVQPARRAAAPKAAQHNMRYGSWQHHREARRSQAASLSGAGTAVRVGVGPGGQQVDHSSSESPDRGQPPGNFKLRGLSPPRPARFHRPAFKFNTEKLKFTHIDIARKECPPEVWNLRLTPTRTLILAGHAGLLKGHWQRT